MNPSCAALFVERNSVYKSLGVDSWDRDRAARRYEGPLPVVAHPPCAQWARLRHLANDNQEEKHLAVTAVALVRRWGGVLEHPAHSTLWDYMLLPKPGAPATSEFSIALPQLWFGHLAEKKTWLFVSGLKPNQLPPVPLSLCQPTHCVDSSKSNNNRLKFITKKQRYATPRAFAQWLIQVATMARSGQ